MKTIPLIVLVIALTLVHEHMCCFKRFFRSFRNRIKNWFRNKARNKYRNKYRNQKIPPRKQIGLRRSSGYGGENYRFSGCETPEHVEEFTGSPPTKLSKSLIIAAIQPKQTNPDVKW